MANAAYHAPDTLEAAIGLLAADPGARVLAGGTDLIVQHRSGRISPSAFIDIKKIARLSGIRALPDGGFAIGAAVACTALLNDAALLAAWPGVVEAANLIGSVQVRNRATMGGNLCNASPAADSVPALVAAGATCLIVGPQGEREVAVAAIPRGPGRTSLGPGEFIAEIRLPPRSGRSGDAYLRATPRTEMDIAVAGVGVSLTLDSAGTCTAARIALGAVAPTVVLAEFAAAALIGSKLEDVALDAMADAARGVCSPIDDKRGSAAYRVHMAGVLARRAVVLAATRTGGNA